MCGIAGLIQAKERSKLERRHRLEAMRRALRHRGPDGSGGNARLVHTRLAVIDLSDDSVQATFTPDLRYSIAYNGEVYNYRELKKELRDFPFRTETDTEVVLAAYLAWGTACLDRFIGMFAFAIWDEREHRLFCARDRFGVKPFYYRTCGTRELSFGSEIKTLFAGGAPRRPNLRTWQTYLATGLYDHRASTFWEEIRSLPPGHTLTWSRDESWKVEPWYDLAKVVTESGEDDRSDDEVALELDGLLDETVQLRFRSDVPVGICLSGGFDSSLLVGLIGRAFGAQKGVHAFTFACGDANYDETPWVRQMLEGSPHQPHQCLLTADEAPVLAERIQRYQDEPYGGLPTLGMAKVHQAARDQGVVVLLDGNGLDEAWGGYDYYQRAGEVVLNAGPVQGARSPSVRPDCLADCALPKQRSLEGSAFPSEPLRALQYRDLRYAKIPRAMRFADRVSMMYSRELREPFLDHRIVELGLRQPARRKVRDGVGKWLPRQLASRLLPKPVGEAPKRPVQTPQREWLRGPLRGWAEDRIEHAIRHGWGLLDGGAVRKAWKEYLAGASDNSFYVWQWISLGMLCEP